MTWNQGFSKKPLREAQEILVSLFIWRGLSKDRQHRGVLLGLFALRVFLVSGSLFLSVFSLLWILSDIAWSFSVIEIPANSYLCLSLPLRPIPSFSSLTAVLNRKLTLSFSNFRKAPSFPPCILITLSRKSGTKFYPDVAILQRHAQQYGRYWFQPNTLASSEKTPYLCTSMYLVQHKLLHHEWEAGNPSGVASNASSDGDMVMLAGWTKPVLTQHPWSFWFSVWPNGP